MEQIKTFLLLGTLSMLLVFIGGYLGGQGGMVIALFMAGGMNFYAYYFSDTMILKHYNAQEVDPREAPMLYRVVERLVERADLPMPKVYIIHDHIPNALPLDVILRMQRLRLQQDYWNYSMKMKWKVLWHTNFHMLRIVIFS